MSLSLRTRVFRLTFFVNVLLSCLLLAFAWWGLEDLEQSVLISDKNAEMHYFNENADKTQPYKVITSQITAAFIPFGAEETETLPVLFNDIPVPFQGDLDFMDKEYFVVTEALPEGNYYLAKSLAVYEEREERLTFYTLSLVAFMVCCCFVLATIFSRRIANPTVQLEQHIMQLDTTDPEARLSTHYVDRELNEIATAINTMLHQIQSTAKRERSLISMASHELRTPVSVILGASRIIEKRKHLTAEDAKTLQRIIDAAEDMSSNIRALLAVVRQTPESLEIEDVQLVEMLEQLKSGYDLERESDSRRLILDLDQQNITIQADKALVRMLLHNLISNALSHTQGQVWVTLSPNSIHIEDQGTTQLDLPDYHSPGMGLGLYIVTLICERLGWTLDIGVSQQGHSIHINF